MQGLWLKSVTTTSATLADLVPADWNSGAIREEPDGKRYRLFKNVTAASGTIAVSLVLEGSTWDGAILGSIIYTTVTKDAIGVTQTSYNGGAASGVVPAAHYFWAQVGGVGDVTGTFTVDLPITGSATDGHAADAAATDTLNAIGTALQTKSEAVGKVLLNIA